jgi:hypothetical protein
MQNSGLRLSDTVCTAPLGPICAYLMVVANTRMLNQGSLSMSLFSTSISMAISSTTTSMTLAMLMETHDNIYKKSFCKLLL